MTWVRLEEAMPEHPKIAQLSDGAFRLHVEGLCYSNRNLTDGFIPTVIAHLRGKRRAIELVDKGVWDAAADGYRIHDFHDFQPSKAEVLELREKRAAAGRAGAESRWQSDSKPHGKRHGKADGKHDATAMAKPCPVPGSVLEGPSEIKPISSGPSPNERNRNDQWDGLEAVFGYSAAGKEAPLWGRLTIELRTLGATKPSIEEAARRYTAHMPTITMTPSALVKHYQRLMAGPPTPPPTTNGQAGKADRTLQLARQAREKELHAGQ